MEPGDATKVTAQLRRGVLEHCVLALLRTREMYTLDLVRELARVSGQSVSEGTLYPMLTRLRRDGKVTTTWHESASGPPRKYFALTDQGRGALETFVVGWRDFTTAIDALLAAPPADPDRAATAGPVVDATPRKGP
ncbi:PadR family transcriptional regulator [Pseudokineococcus sp. 1T1Z-3]|uniref:PadR family transcriptional regulator n=1 Tax=Pseudokineococcus sp. 1T1Z-3 TaxID=3132745 RepID=UPI0030A1CDB5